MSNHSLAKSTAEILQDRPESMSIDRPKVQLIYRGSVFNYTRSPITIDRTDRSNWQIVNLICKGHTYERKLPPPQPYQKPRALNWRWQ
jgi:hypothetical protein